MMLVPLAVALPLIAAALLAGLRPVLPRLLGDATAIAAAVATTAILATLTVLSARQGTMVYWFGGWHPNHGAALGIAFAVDPFGAATATVGAVLTTGALCFAWRYFDSLGTLFPTLILVFLAGVAGYTLSGDLFTIFVFFEVMSTCAYALTGYKIEGPSLMGALAFAIINTLGAILLLWGIALLYGRFGALNLSQLGRAVSAVGHPDAALVAALALMATGFLTKAAVLPFQFWHADADAVAPTPVCLLISSVMAPLGLVGLARVYWTVFAGSLPATGGPWTILLWLGGGTALLGAVLSLRQRHLKRLLAFTTIGHVGMMLSGLATGVAGGLGGMLLYLGADGLAIGALFLAVGIVLHRLGSVDIPEIHGRGGEMQWAALLFVLGALALAAIPPFGTFEGKAGMEDGLRTAGPLASAVLPWVFVLCSGCTSAAVLSAAARIFLGWGPAPAAEDAPTSDDGAETKQGAERTPLPLKLAPSVLLALCLALGLTPGLRCAANGAAARFLDSSGYRAAVLNSRPTGPLSLAPATSLWPSALTVAASLLLALLVTALIIGGGNIPQALRRVAELAGTPARLLEQLHSGDVEDYAAWLALGAATLGVGFLLAV